MDRLKTMLLMLPSLTTELFLLRTQAAFISGTKLERSHSA